MAGARFPARSSRRTCCATPSPPTSSTTAPTCAWCSCCSCVPPIWRRRCASARSTSLYRDADELDVRQDAELGGGHLDPGRAEVLDQQRRDAVDEGLDQAVLAALGEVADPE